jgi:hypothetical protein
MGRPLNKKYFGNRNIGSISVTTDNGIGGSSIASVTLNALGSYTARPTTTFSDPQLPNGVKAVGTVTSQVNIITAFGGTMSDYTSGDVVTIGNGTLFTITAVDGAITGATINERGSYPYAAGTLPSGAQTVTNITVTNPAATGATFTVNYNAKEVLITEPGSGYSSATVTFTQSVTATSVNLAADTGAVSSSTNQENAITAYAWIGNGGGSRQKVDIVKQESSRRYAVRTATLVSGEPWTVRSAILVAKTGGAAADTDGDNTFNEMDITAFDAAGKEYWVLKLTAHKALIKRKASNTDGEFADPTTYPNGQNVAWTMNSTSGTKVYAVQPYLAAGINVKIDNA